MNVHMSRRGFIFGAAAFSIVRPEILMPIKSIELPCTGPLWPAGPTIPWNVVRDEQINAALAFPTPKSWAAVSRILANME